MKLIAFDASGVEFFREPLVITSRRAKYHAYYDGDLAEFADRSVEVLTDWGYTCDDETGA